ncbi:phage portal protein [Christensenellaceae bacterium OttesenSCG-928-M15]|nr:phage portal protein [Christensenellaceae bacterium OttesenSCG-928-M15]
MNGDIRPALERPVTISLPEDVQIGPKLIEYCTTKYVPELRRYRRLISYYMTENAIAKRQMDDPTKPNNKIAHAFARYISRIATAYFMGTGVKIECDDEPYLKALRNIYSSNMAEVKFYEEAKGMSQVGRSYELLYINSDGELKTAAIEAENMIPIYGQSTGSYLTAAIRRYTTVELIGTRPRNTEHADVYTATEVFTFERRQGRGSKWKFVDQWKHTFSDVPVIVRWNNTEQKGDYEDVITLIDAYDRAQSDTMNDLDYFTDAYLAISGAEDIVTDEDEETDEPADAAKSIRTMKQERLLLFPEGGDAKFVVKNIDDTSTENFKNRTYQDIFFTAMVPNLTDESFAGNLSGIAMKYKLFGIEELAAEKEKYFTSSEKKKIRLITEYINARYGTAYDWRTVELSFDRSNIANLLEISQIINNLRGLLSDKTLIGMWPEIDNALKEWEHRLWEKAQEENDDLPPGLEEILINGSGQ